MGAGASGTGKDKDLSESQDHPQQHQSNARNYVPICDPPQYDLTFDSTDSEITELQEERANKPIPKVLPLPVPAPKNRNEELSLITEEVLEEQATSHRLEEEPTIQSAEEEVRVSSLDTPQEIDEQETEPRVHEEEKLIPILVKASTCDLSGKCRRPDVCKLRRCQRQVSFAEDVNYCDNPYCPKKHSQSAAAYESELSLEEEEGDCSEEEEVDAARGGCHCCKLHRVEESDEEEEEEDEEGMPDYQRYSREQPEKDSSSSKKGLDCGNMRDCCRPGCPNRTASLKHNNAQLNGNSNACRCSRSQAKPGSRHNSESYVSYRGPGKNPSHSKSAPNQLDERDSYQAFQEIDHSRPFASRRSPPGPHSAFRQSNKPRGYPPGYDLHVNPDRPHIPLPPTPQQFSTEQPAVPPHQNLHQHQSRNSRDSRESDEHDERKEMYSHNTNRNYATKTPYQRGYNRQPLKPYPYEEPQGSDSLCSNNCSGYDHCPMHHGCRCQCLCPDDTHYCPQAQSDDQLSYCSDSSNSECMNLAYQRTGDYPELMDELETTLSHRNRIRVQKTMQRFEMLSRQNKNLEKPIFEDDESLRHYNMGISMRDNRDAHECKCRHCEEKHRRQNNYSTRSEALAKRANYQPTPFPRNSGYVEKVARYMDPNLNNRRENNARKVDDRHDMPATLTNGNGTWQMDARKNEWVKVDQGHSGGGPNQYDFEGNYPPLPPRPISEHMYDRRSFAHDRHDRGPPCSCPKCLRRR